MSELQKDVWGIRADVFPQVQSFLAGGGNADQLREQTEGAAPSDTTIQEKVAVIPLQGMVTPKGTLLGQLFGGDSGLQGFRARIARAAEDDSITSILLHVDSPGGLVELVPEAAADIRLAREAKPVVAVANTMAASAAYWLAAQANEVVVTPSGRVGSVGVFSVHEDVSKMAEEKGVKLTMISAGKFKTEGNPYEPLGDEARAAIQERIDEVYGMFVADLAKGRGTSAESVRKDFGQGRMLSPKAALAAGMVDRIATFEETAARLVRGRSRIKGTGALRLTDELDGLRVESGEATTRFEEAVAERVAQGRQLSEETRVFAGEVAEALEADAERLRDALAIEPREEHINSDYAAVIERARFAALQYSR